MEASDLFNGQLPFPINFTTIAIGLAVVLAAVAFLRGVLGMFVGLGCLAAGAFAGYWSHDRLPEWLGQVSEDPQPRVVFFASLAIAFIAYVVLRLLAGAILLSPLRRSGSKLIGGPVGAALSLIPAAGAIFVIGIALRMAGSFFSVEHTDAGVATEEGGRVAERPFWARLNEAMDRDQLGSLIARLDPLKARARGAISNLLVTLKDNAAGGKLSDDPLTANVLSSEAMRNLADDPELRELAERGDFIRLLDHPKVRDAAANPKIAELLRDLRVEQVVDRSLFAPAEGEGGGAGLLRRKRILRGG